MNSTSHVTPKRRDPVAKNVNLVRCATHTDKKKESKKNGPSLE